MDRERERLSDLSVWERVSQREIQKERVLECVHIWDRDIHTQRETVIGREIKRMKDTPTEKTETVRKRHSERERDKLLKLSFHSTSSLQSVMSTLPCPFPYRLRIFPSFISYLFDKFCSTNHTLKLSLNFWNDKSEANWTLRFNLWHFKTTPL